MAKVEILHKNTYGIAYSNIPNSNQIDHNMKPKGLKGCPFFLIPQMCLSVPSACFTL